MISLESPNGLYSSLKSTPPNATIGSLTQWQHSLYELFEYTIAPFWECFAPFIVWSSTYEQVLDNPLLFAAEPPKESMVLPKATERLPQLGSRSVH